MSNGDALNGNWKSDWGTASIEIDGDSFTGKWSKGTWEGKISGDKVAATWTHKDGTTGKAALAIEDDGAKLVGTWGWASDSDGGDWVLTQTKRTKTAAAKAEEEEAKKKAAEEKAKAEAEKKAKAEEAKKKKEEEAAAKKKAAEDKEAADDKKKK